MVQLAFDFKEDLIHTLPYDREIDIVGFAGAGGSSEGIMRATGRPISLAVNHDKEAIWMHARNHPDTLHLTEDIYDVNIQRIISDRKVGIAWFSPDCTHFSNAKGKKPLSNKRRGLARVINEWTKYIKPRIIIVENVKEFLGWGPLDKKGRPIAKKKRKYFKRFVCRLYKAGYTHIEWRVLKAHEYGVPTTRERLYLIARSDGQSINWPVKTHGYSKELKKPVAAHTCIDWSIPGYSIFMTKKEASVLRKETGVIVRRPLAEHTMERIARGIKKFVFDVKEPFIISIDNKSSKSGVMASSEPLRTITCENRFAAVMPFLAKYHKQTKSTESRCYDLQSPIYTIDTSNRFGLVAAHVSKFYSTNIGSSCGSPLPTVTATGNHLGMVSAFLMKYYGSNIGSGMDEPMHTITTNDRFGLVMIHGEAYQIVDITLRMLLPHELAAAMGFPKSYIFTGSRKQQVAKIGNAVCPKMAELIVAANFDKNEQVVQAA